MKFYDCTQGNTTLLYTATSSPYNYTWTSPAAGMHILTAMATDSYGAIEESTPVNVTIWATRDINASNGSASYSSGTFTVAGRGTGITGTSDGFRFVYLPVTGNCTIIAHVATFSSTNANSSAGVMIRNNDVTDAGATEASSGYHPTSPTGISSHFRLTKNGTTTVTTVAQSSPYWVKVVRSGSTLSAYRSTNGTSWTQVSTNQTISMTDPVQVGLAVTSGSTSTTNTATISSVSITQP